jgi:hypothetical protein
MKENKEMIDEQFAYANAWIEEGAKQWVSILEAVAQNRDAWFKSNAKLSEVISCYQTAHRYLNNIISLAEERRKQEGDK